MIMKQYIKAFAYSRKKARDTINSYAYKLNEHVIKCIIFGKLRPESKVHWIKEIANWLVECDKSQIQQANLKTKDYNDTIFEFFAETMDETEYGLIHFEKTNLEKHEGEPGSLPYFEINSKMVNKLFNCYTDLRDICIPRFQSKTFHEKNSWISVLTAIIDDNLYDFQPTDIIDSTHDL